MAEPAISLHSVENRDEAQKIKEKIFNTHTEELIIGLCGPIGTDIHFVTSCLKRVLEENFNYECVDLKLSDFIRDHSKYINNNIPIDFDSHRNDEPLNYYEKLIDAGNKLREKYGADILAEISINKIAEKRETKTKDGTYKSIRVCYIIDSIKNLEELELFRLVYRELFYFVGVFSSLEHRSKRLVNRGMQTHEVYKLIDRDSGEEIQFGQKVTDTFKDADFFLRIEESTQQSIEPKIKRFLNLIFSSDIVTPSIYETAMYLASAASGNSACLSRQVGASITDNNGDVIAVGWNDVPKSGGGVYQYNEDDPTSRKDFRCLNKEGGMCFNDDEKSQISQSLVAELIKKGIVQNADINKAVQVIKESKIKDLVEFSRAVHAEMLAIILGSQKVGDRVKNGKLFSTTYPCHNCARHIVAAGIKEVYYIEPYRKSLAIKLHGDSITEDETRENLVRILMFDGVSPRRYLELFKSSPNSRKMDGKKVFPSLKEIYPKKTISLQAIPLLEKRIAKDLADKQLI